MRSQTRIECDNAVLEYSKIVKNNIPANNKLIYIGVAGDPDGGEYTPLFKPEFQTFTFDADPKWVPDIVGDITKTEFDNESWGCIVCVQVLEHVKNIWDVPKEMNRILCKGGYAIVDTPFLYPFHPEEPSFGDYWRLTKMGMATLFEPYFSIINIKATDNLTSALIQKI